MFRTGSLARCVILNVDWVRRRAIASFELHVIHVRRNDEPSKVRDARQIVAKAHR
jgi:hypothetical protein